MTLKPASGLAPLTLGLAALTLAGAHPAAATVTFGSVTPIDTTAPAGETSADVDLSQPGTVDYAVTFGATGNLVTLTNGNVIAFGTGSNSTATVTGQGTATNAANFNPSTGNANFDADLNNFSYDGSAPKVLTLNNLTPGTSYLAQLFALDDRGGYGYRNVQFADPSAPTDTSGTFSVASNDYVDATFTADSTGTQVINENLPNGAGNLNDVVLYAEPTIKFSAPTPITTADAVLGSSNGLGSVLEAQAFGQQSDTNVTVGSETITFDGYSDAAPTATATGTPGGLYAFSATTGNAAFDTILGTYNYDGTNPKLITVNGLTAGDTYNVQLFGLDDRGGVPGRTISFSDPTYGVTSDTIGEGYNDYVVETFTATGATQAIDENFGNGYAGNINALVVYSEASAAPEPSQVGMLALMGFGLGGLMLRARKRSTVAA